MIILMRNVCMYVSTSVFSWVLQNLSEKQKSYPTEQLEIGVEPFLKSLGKLLAYIVSRPIFSAFVFYWLWVAYERHLN